MSSSDKSPLWAKIVAAAIAIVVAGYLLVGISILGYKFIEWAIHL